MLIESESATHGPIFSDGRRNFFTIYTTSTPSENIRPHRHTGIHIALQENDMTGAVYVKRFHTQKSNNTATIIVLRVIWDAKKSRFSDFLLSHL